MTPRPHPIPLPMSSRGGIAAAVLAVVALTVAGCTSHDGTDPQPTSPSSSAATPPGAARAVDATREMQNHTCKHDGGGWTFTGEIKNPEKTSRNYTVIPRIAAKKNTKLTLGLTTITKTVPGGKTVSFLAKDFSQLTSSGNTCVITVSKI